MTRNRVTAALAATVVTLLLAGSAAALADPVPIPSRELHVGGRDGPLDTGDWVSVAQSQEELADAWGRLHQPGALPVIEIGQDFVVVTSRMTPCLEPPREQTAAWQEGVLVVRVSEEPTPGLCPAAVGRVDWAAAVERDALPGDVTAAVFIGPDGDELARIDVSIDGQPSPEPTLPETGLPLAALLALALASLLTGGALTLRAGRGQSASLHRRQPRT